MFAEFVKARSGRLIRVAHLLTGDWERAENLLHETLTRAKRRWSHFAEDPERLVIREMAARSGAEKDRANAVLQRFGGVLDIDGPVAVLPDPDGLTPPRAYEFKEKRRRRTPALLLIAGAVVLALVLLGGYQTKLLKPKTPQASPKANPTSFPAFSWGGKLAKSSHGSLSAKSVTVTWTPTTSVLSYESRCTGELANGGHLVTEIDLDGKTIGGGSCGGRSTYHGSMVTAGVPATLTLKVLRQEVRIADADGKDTVIDVPLPDGTIALAIYDEVAFEDYPFPSRPPELKPLPAATACPQWPILVRNDPADPLNPVSRKVIWQEGLVYALVSQTPGRFSLTVNGTELVSVTHWDYGHGGSSGNWSAEASEPKSWKRPKPGTEVTVTLTPRDVTGGWKLGLRPSTEAEMGWSTSVC